jgi:hypothetical protein
MRALALTTTTVLAVDPRPSYLRILEEPAARHEARLELSGLMSGSEEPTREQVASALATLHVSMACARPDQRRAGSIFAATGWRSVHGVPGLRCFAP